MLPKDVIPTTSNMQYGSDSRMWRGPPESPYTYSEVVRTRKKKAVLL
jgi:hypothetical protein